MADGSKEVDYHIQDPPLRPSPSDLWFVSYLPWSLSGGLSAPLIPLLALALYPDIGAFGVAIVVAASDISEIPLTIVWGNFSDTVRHRKGFMVVSFALTGAILIAMPFSNSLTTYYWLNVFGGVASAASAPIGTILLLETRTKHWWPRDVGLFGLVSGIGTVLGLALGGVWMYIFAPGSLSGMQAISAMKYLLMLTGVLALVASLLAFVWIQEPKQYLKRGEIVDQPQLGKGIVERIRGFRRRIVALIQMIQGEPVPLPLREWVFLGSLFAVSLGSQIFYGTFVFYLVSPTGAALTEGAVFFVFLASAFASTSLSYSSGKAAERYSPKRLFVGAMLARSLVIPLFIFGTTGYFVGHVGIVGTMVLLNGIMGVTWAFASTASTIFMLRLLTGNTNRGKALGLYNALAGFGGLAGTLIGGYLYHLTGATEAYLLAALVVFVGCVILLPITYKFAPYRQVIRPIEAKETPPPKPRAPPLAAWENGDHARSS